MTKKLLTLLLVLTAAFCSFSTKVKASHAAGAELTYQWVSDSTYRIFFKFYRDCTGISQDLSEGLCVNPTCSNSALSPFNVTLNPMSSPLPTGYNNGTPLYTGCPQYKTTCDSPSSILPGYQEWWYSGLVTFPGRCTWTLSVFVSARNNSVNIAGGGNLHLEATLNNMIAQGNSSPYFSVKPVPYVCINQPYNYNNGGIDPDKDSLSFELVQPLTDNSNCPSTITTLSFSTASPSYNIFNNPFQTNNTFNLNSNTGQITFTPAVLGGQTIAIRAKEYRQGVLIGSCMRDVQVQVLNCTSTTMVPSTPTALINATYSSGTVIKNCGASSLNFCFYVKASDPTSVLVVSDNRNQVTPGAVITYSNVNKDSVRGCFSWVPTAADTGLKLLSITVKDSTCRAPGVSVSQTFTYPVQINPSNPPSVTPAIGYCQYSAANALTATGLNLLWYTTATGGTGSATAPTPNTSVTGVTTWYVSQSYSPGCETSRASITVTVSAKPSPPVVTPLVAYCTGNNTTPLTASGSNIKWYTQAIGGIGNATAPTPSSTAIGTFKWYVSQTVNGCESDRDSVTVSVISGAAAPVAPTNIKYCQGDAAVPLTANGAGFLWYTTFSGGIGSTFAPVPNTSIVGDSYYYVSQVAGNCETPRTPVRVIVYKKPTPDLAGIPDSLCQYQSVTIDTLAGLPATAKFTWSTGSGATVTGNSPGPFIIKFNKDGNQKISLNIINGVCNVSDSVSVFVKTAPDAFFSVKSDVCVKETAVVNSITLLDNALYFWTLDKQRVFDSLYKTQYQLSWDTTGTSRLELVLLAPNGCYSLPHYQDITIHKTEANISDFSRSYFCIGDTIILSTTKGGDYIYEWSPEGTFLTNALAEASALVKGPEFVFLKVSDKWNCTSYDTAFIKADACCDLKLADAFTPNGDGLNDKFHVLTLGHHSILTFMVKNRWGQTVFSTSNESEGWDGTYKGTIQDPDTYFYYLKYKCENNVIFEKQGNITLVR